MPKRRGRGEGSITQLPSGHWRAVFSHGATAGRRVRLSKTSEHKIDVIKWLAKQRTDATSGRLVDPRGMKLGEFIDRWLAIIKPTVENGTYEQYKRSIDKLVKPRLGSVAIANLSVLDVDTFYDKMTADGITAADQFKAGSALRMVLKAAVRRGLASYNAAAEVKLPKVGEPHIVTWNESQLRKFVEKASHHRLHALFLLAADTGARKGELLALTWPDVNFDAGTVAFVKSLEERNGKRQIKGNKTKKSRRILPVTKATIAALLAHRDRMKEAGRYDDHGTVFMDADGHWLRSSNLNRRDFAPLIKAAGVPAIRFHDLRHTCATLLLRDGENIKVVSERLGHANVVTTLRTYAHVMPGMQESATDRMAKFIGPRLAHGDGEK